MTTTYEKAARFFWIVVVVCISFDGWYFIFDWLLSGRLPRGR